MASRMGLVSRMLKFALEAEANEGKASKNTVVIRFRRQLLINGWEERASVLAA